METEVIPNASLALSAESPRPQTYELKNLNCCSTHRFEIRGAAGYRHSNEIQQCAFILKLNTACLILKIKHNMFNREKETLPV